jgi:hypothetical protein
MADVATTIKQHPNIFSQIEPEWLNAHVWTPMQRTTEILAEMGINSAGIDEKSRQVFLVIADQNLDHLMAIICFSVDDSEEKNYSLQEVALSVAKYLHVMAVTQKQLDHHLIKQVYLPETYLELHGCSRAFGHSFCGLLFKLQLLQTLCKSFGH